MAIPVSEFSNFCADWVGRKGNGYNLGSITRWNVSTDGNYDKIIAVLEAYIAWLEWARDNAVADMVDESTQLNAVMGKVWAVVTAAETVRQDV